MTKEFYGVQMSRLVAVFGDKAFNKEFRILAWEAVRDMDSEAFSRVVSDWIGERLPHQAPRMKDFREQFYDWQNKDQQKRAASAWKEQFRNMPDNQGKKLDLHGANNVIDLMEKVKQGKIKLPNGEGA